MALDFVHAHLIVTGINDIAGRKRHRTYDIFHIAFIERCRTYAEVKVAIGNWNEVRNMVKNVGELLTI